MSTITRYECDKCARTVLNRGDLWVLELRRSCLNSTTDRSYMAPNRTQDWCRDCVEEAHLLPQRNVHKELPPEPTMEELLRNFVEEVISDVMEASR